MVGCCACVSVGRLPQASVGEPMALVIKFVRAVEVRRMKDRVEATVTTCNARGREHAETWVLPSDEDAEVAYCMLRDPKKAVEWLNAQARRMRVKVTYELRCPPHIGKL